MTNMFISVDLGGTNTRVAGVTSLRMPVFETEPYRRRNTHNYDQDLRFIVDSARKLAGNKPVEAVGFGAAGGISEDKSHIEGSINLKQWVGKLFVADIASALGCSVFLDNDGVAAGLGEAYYGPTKTDFHYIIWGTGISVVSIVHDKTGPPHAARINWRSFCSDWEAECGGGSLKNLYGKEPGLFGSSEWANVLERFRYHLAQYVEIKKPQVIVFGGGLAMLHRADILRTQSEADLLVSGFGPDVGLLGGLALIRRDMNI